MRPISLRSITVITPKKAISRLTSSRALMTVRMNPSGTGAHHLHGAGAGAPGVRPGEAHDAAGDRAREPRRPADLAAVEAHDDVLAGCDAEALRVLVVQQHLARPLEVQPLGPLHGRAGEQGALGDQLQVGRAR